MNLRSLVAVTVVLSASTAGSVAAQSPSGTGLASVRGLSLGVSATASGIDADGHQFGPHNGGGLSVALGYGATDAVTLFVRGTIAYQHAHYDAGARYSFGTPLSRVRPYLEGALTYTGSRERGLAVRGPALTAGAGLEYFLTRNLSLDAGFSYVQGRYTAGEGTREIPELGDDFRSGRFSVGLKVRP
jgi:opacity protein-like surface antigen